MFCVLIKSQMLSDNQVLLASRMKTKCLFKKKNTNKNRQVYSSNINNLYPTTQTVSKKKKHENYFPSENIYSLFHLIWWQSLEYEQINNMFRNRKGWALAKLNNTIFYKRWNLSYINSQDGICSLSYCHFQEISWQTKSKAELKVSNLGNAFFMWGSCK